MKLIPGAHELRFVGRLRSALLTRVDRIRAQVWVRLPLQLHGRSGEPRRAGEAPRVIALTSYPPRIGSVHLTLRSLLKQSMAVDVIYLVLSILEFPSGESDLPSNLRRLLAVSKGRIKVHFTADNKRSFKKLLPIIELHPDATILTADDDVLYWRSWAKQLDSASLIFPTAVIGTRGTQIKLDGRCARPYTEWPGAQAGIPTQLVFLTGRGGILYPPNSLDPRVFDWGTASLLCPSADDIWFKVMASLAGVEAVKIDAGREYPSNGASQSGALWRRNVSKNQNDVAFKAVVDFFDIWDMYAAAHDRRL